MKKMIIASVAISALCGCVSYEPKPIDWAKEVQAFNAQEGATYIFTSFDEVGKYAVIHNHELNALRLKLATSEAVADVEGLWEDPEVDFDFLRFLKPDENPFTCCASVAQTIPLWGDLGCEKKAAQFYSEADRWAIKTAEREIYATAKRLAIEYALGDNGLVCDCVELCNCLSLPFGCKLKLPSVCLCAGDLEVCKCRSCAEMVKHSKVREMEARYNGSESRLDAEIRKQYPQLKLGTAYEREEGIDRVGIVAGLTLPLWNRNRKGIAEANGEREEARAEVIATWREVVNDYFNAHSDLTIAVNKCKCGDNCECKKDARLIADVLIAKAELEKFDIE